MWFKTGSMIELLKLGMRESGKDSRLQSKFALFGATCRTNFPRQKASELGLIVVFPGGDRDLI